MHRGVHIYAPECCWYGRSHRYAAADMCECWLTWPDIGPGHGMHVYAFHGGDLSASCCSALLGEDVFWNSEVTCGPSLIKGHSNALSGGDLLLRAFVVWHRCRPARGFKGTCGANRNAHASLQGWMYIPPRHGQWCYSKAPPVSTPSKWACGWLGHTHV